MFIPEVAPSADTNTPRKVSRHCVYTWGSVLIRITIRKARRLMLSDAAVLLQKGHVDAHGKDIHRGSLWEERLLFIHPSYSTFSQKFACHSTKHHFTGGMAQV